MSPQVPISPTTVVPEKCNIAEAQDKHLKVVFMNIIEVLKKMYGKMNTQWKKINKRVPHLNVKIRSTKKTQAKGNIEMKILGNPTEMMEPSLTNRL